MRKTQSLLFRVVEGNLNNLSILALIITVVKHIEVHLLLARVVSALLSLSDTLFTSLLGTLKFRLKNQFDSLAGLFAKDSLLTADLFNTVDVAAESLHLLLLSKQSVSGSLCLLDSNPLHNLIASVIISLSPLLGSLNTVVSHTSVLSHHLNTLLFCSDEFLSQGLS